MAEAFFQSALAGQSGPAPDFGRPWSAPALPLPDDPVERRNILLALAPAMLLDQICLAGAAQPATAHRPAECHLFDLYCHSIGLDNPAVSAPFRFRAGLTLAGVALPSLNDPAFFQTPGIPDFAWNLPTAQLCLFHWPRRYFPELLGWTLAHNLREPAWWDGWQGADPSDMARNRTLAHAALQACEGLDEERIRAGWDLYRRLFAELLNQTAATADRKLPAKEALALIIQARRSHAVGHHGRILLAGRSLDEWLADPDPEPLLRALRGSPWVDWDRPVASRLIRAMDFGGPMFGVFDRAERQVWLDWIEAEDRPIPLAPQAPAFVPRPAEAGLAPGDGFRSKRALYTVLLGAESTVDVPERAVAVMHRILRLTRIMLPLQRGHRRFFPYSETGLHARTEAIHAHEIKRYRPSDPHPQIGKDFCHWVILQLAPTILIDGCWLARIGTAAECLDTAGRHLLKIYADELGNGLPERNHPNVYRHLLDRLGIELPPFDSPAFANDPRFLDAAFDLPVYLLAMGLCPQRCFPELLGLNLAIELSGLGAGYMRLIDVLRSHGIDPAIVQLHLSIDNLASGHAARAREAIMLYLDEMERKGGRKISRQLWKRIWTGYLSLHTAASSLAWRLHCRSARSANRKEH
ncbi:iron-containing redox enzyme family protein [Methylococcus capsulatus]|nr:iron-containing redox enzyme family protein [Methylococcus capsulatus]